MKSGYRRCATEILSPVLDRDALRTRDHEDRTVELLDMPSGPVAAYMTGLDAGDTSAALAPFSESVEYIRPAIYRHEQGVQVVRGRAQLAGFFERRGGQPTKHVILWQVAGGRSFFGEGRIVRPADGEMLRRFLFRAEIDERGDISRYIAALA